LPSDIQAVDLRKLRLLNNARRIDDLRIPPANRLEALQGRRRGQHSIRTTINGGFALFGEMAMPMRSKSSTITERLPNPSPGEILAEEFLKPMGLSQTALARAIGVPPRRINEIVLGKRTVTADTDLRLARYFRMSDGFFLGLQTDHDLMQRRREIGDQLKAIRPRAA
jgi:addiction module HigA family antidote